MWDRTACIAKSNSLKCVTLGEQILRSVLYFVDRVACYDSW